MVAVAVLLPAAAVADVLGWPVPLPPALRSNLVLALGLSCLAVWWGGAVRRLGGGPLGVVAWVGAGAVTVGLLATWALVLGALGLLPPRLIRWVFAALALEAPLWALTLLAWPGSREEWAGGRLSLAVHLVTVGLAVALLFWDFLYRPLGGLPTLTAARVAWASWALVLASLGLASVRGARMGAGGFRFLFASIVMALSGSYVVTVVPTWPPRLILAFGVGALLLRLGAAEALRLAARSGAPDRGVSPGAGAAWLASATLVLLTLHGLAARPEPGGWIWVAVLSLGSLVLVGRALGRRGPAPPPGPTA